MISQGKSKVPHEGSTMDMRMSQIVEEGTQMHSRAFQYTKFVLS